MASPSDPYNHHWHFSDLSDKTFQLHGRSLAVALVFFSLLLFFTFLFVYFFYVCTHRRHSATVRSTSNPTAPHVVELGLDPVTINALPIFLHGPPDNSGGLEVECSICISMFQEGERVKVLPQCRHAFHSQCVDKWLMTHSSCPLCRTAILRGDSLAGAGLIVWTGCRNGLAS